jgi:RNA polymerase sigma factor (sigma-70 family)
MVGKVPATAGRMWQVCQEPQTLTGFSDMLRMRDPARAVMRAPSRIRFMSTPKGWNRAHLRQLAGSRHRRSITTSQGAYRMPRNDGSVKDILETLMKPDGELTRFIRRRIGNPDDAEDIKQVTCARFVRLWEESRVPIENPKAYIIGIAGKVIFEHWREVGYRKRLFDLGATREEAEDVEDRDARLDDIESKRREQALLRQAMKVALTPVQRAVLLRRLDGAPVAEAGLPLGLSGHQTERILHDARESLREYIRSREGSKR